MEYISSKKVDDTPISLCLLTPVVGINKNGKSRIHYMQIEEHRDFSIKVLKVLISKSEIDKNSSIYKNMVDKNMFSDPNMFDIYKSDSVDFYKVEDYKNCIKLEDNLMITQSYLVEKSYKYYCIKMKPKTALDILYFKIKNLFG
jgi:hypothetical protein